MGKRREKSVLRLSPAILLSNISFLYTRESEIQNPKFKEVLY